MNYPKSELYFLLSFIAVVAVIVFFIFQPFLAPLILAVIFTTVFSPIHKRILSITQNNHGLAALLSTAFVLVVIVVPVTFLSIQIFKEATQVYSSLVTDGGTASIFHEIETVIRSTGLPLPEGTLDFRQYLKQGLNLLIQNLDTVFSNVAKIMVDIFLLLVGLYYFFKEGIMLRKTAIALSPLRDSYDETIFHKLELAVNGVVRGNMLIALIQGSLTAIGLTFFGVPNPVLWGSVASIAALVPGFGTSLVLIPSILYLFFTGATTSAVGLVLWWFGGIGLVDNFLGPKLVGHGVQLHSFLILLSVLGGISIFGPLGFLFGPLAFSLFFALLEIYSSIRKERGA